MVFFQPCLLPGMVRLRWFPIFCAMVHGKVSLEEFYCSLRFRQMKVTIVELFDCLSNSWLLSLGVLFFFAISQMNSESQHAQRLNVLPYRAAKHRPVSCRPEKGCQLPSVGGKHLFQVFPQLLCWYRRVCLGCVPSLESHSQPTG